MRISELASDYHESTGSIWDTLHFVYITRMTVYDREVGESSPSNENETIAVMAHERGLSK